MNFKSVLYLDDMRTPLIFGIEAVRSYDQFVQLLESGKQYDLISLDHDLSLEHYLPEENWNKDIPFRIN